MAQRKRTRKIRKRIQALSRAGYVDLPMDWLRKHNLVAGESEVDITVYPTKLVIAPTNENASKKRRS